MDVRVLGRCPTGLRQEREERSPGGAIPIAGCRAVGFVEKTEGEHEAEDGLYDEGGAQFLVFGRGVFVGGYEVFGFVFEGSAQGRELLVFVVEGGAFFRAGRWGMAATVDGGGG